MASWPSYGLVTISQPLQNMVSDALALVDEMRQAPDREGAIRIARVEFGWT